MTLYLRLPHPSELVVDHHIAMLSLHFVYCCLCQELLIIFDCSIKKVISCNQCGNLSSKQCQNVECRIFLLLLADCLNKWMPTMVPTQDLLTSVVDCFVSLDGRWLLCKCPTLKCSWLLYVLCSLLGNVSKAAQKKVMRHYMMCRR